MRGQLRGDIESRLAQAVQTLNGTEITSATGPWSCGWDRDCSEAAEPMKVT
jgi:hypothetical protein